MNFKDIIYEKAGGVAFITINRPKTLNAFRDVTLNEMITAFTDAWGDVEIGVVVLRGAGGKAFCSGGDLKEKKGVPAERTASLESENTSPIFTTL